MRHVSVANLTTSPALGLASRALCTLAALAQLALVLYALPQLVLRPRWAEIVAALGGAARANVLGVPLLHAAVLVGGNAFFAALYALHALPAVERLRSGGAGAGGPWHFSAAASAAQRAAFWARVPWALGSTLFNVLLTVPLAAGNYSLAVRLGHSASAEAFPSTPALLAQLAAFVLVEDALFYAGHRLLHSSPLLYASVHKVHHAWVQTTSIAAEATHPLEFVLCNVLPFATGPLVLGAHLATLYVWTVWRILETVAHHSGFELPTSMFTLLPFQGDSRAHDLHHSRGGGVLPRSGNFASFFKHCDVLGGTVLLESGGGDSCEALKAS
jgi:sterol desaturase/sphingolipid hydroxylase (fatty acid hydroxylase superfamily)